MSLLVVGLNHRTASLPLLERAVLDEPARAKLLTDLRSSPSVAEAAVLSTCNRVEVYADVTRFHGGVTELTELLARHTSMTADSLHPHLYVHFEDRAVQHLFEVAAGLDSMIVGEAQILGQVRNALTQAQESQSVGRVLNEALQRALRAGKRAHAETGIDKAGVSVVSVALATAASSLGGLDGRTAVVVGAGSMAALAATQLQRAGIGGISIVNRTPERAERLAAQVGGSAHPIDELPRVLGDADLVVSCTGATGFLVTAEAVATARADRGDQPLVLLDLALPRDIDPAVLALPNVALVDMEDLGDLMTDDAILAAIESARRIVAEEIAAHVAALRADEVAPVVVALRDRADNVVAAELERLQRRLPGLDVMQRAELEQTVRRVVDKLLHTPTVRVKELAEQPPVGSYAEALHRLFDLDPQVVEVISEAALVEREDAGTEPGRDPEPGS